MNTHDAEALRALFVSLDTEMLYTAGAHAFYRGSQAPVFVTPSGVEPVLVCAYCGGKRRDGDQCVSCGAREQAVNRHLPKSNRS